MSDPVQYAVFLFPSAIEELGEAVAPYLQEGPGGRHVLCSEIDSGGALFEMKVNALSDDGRVRELELMVPVGMIKLVIAVQQDGRFGFARRPKGYMAVAAAPPAKAAEAATASAATAPASTLSGDIDPAL